MTAAVSLSSPAMWTKSGQSETYSVFYYDYDDAKSEYARFDANTTSRN